MLGAWLGYLLFVAAALLFYVMFTGWLAGYVLALVILVPVMSLLLSLPGILGLRVSLRPDAGGRRGQPVKLALLARNRARLPVGRVAARFVFENRLTGERAKEAVHFPLGCGDEALGRLFAAPNCGVVECRAQFLRAYDLLGLFPVPLRPVPTVSMLVRPDPSGRPPLGMAQDALGENTIRQEKGVSLEDYSVRDYREGDTLRSVHWKLSSKLEQLVVRQAEGGQQADLLLLFDCWGTPERLNLLLERLAACSAYLQGYGRGHDLCWHGSGANELCREHVESPADFERFLWRVGSQRAPAGPTDVRALHGRLEAAVPPSHIFYIDTEDGEGATA